MTVSERLSKRRRRLAVASVVAFVSVIIAATAHAAAGGETPSIVALVSALAVSTGIGMIVIGARLTRARAAVGVVVDQVAFHALFSFFGPISGTDALAVHSSAHAEHTMSPLPAVADAAAATSSDPMLLTHLGAATAAYLLLRRGLAAIAAIIVALETALSRIFDTPHVAHPVAAAPIVSPHDEIRPLSALAHHRVPDRRGPPALIAR
jgi:hypothetical protein